MVAHLHGARNVDIWEGGQPHLARSPLSSACSYRCSSLGCDLGRKGSWTPRAHVAIQGVSLLWVCCRMHSRDAARGVLVSRPFIKMGRREFLQGLQEFFQVQVTPQVRGSGKRKRGKSAQEGLAIPFQAASSTQWTGPVSDPAGQSSDGASMSIVALACWSPARCLPGAAELGQRRQRSTEPRLWHLSLLLSVSVSERRGSRRRRASFPNSRRP